MFLAWLLLHSIVLVMDLKKRWIAIYGSVIVMTLVLTFGTRMYIPVIYSGNVIPRKNCIVIDAGHGGIDGGATSCTGILESRLNLEIALKLEAVLHLLGHDTTMIRRTDISVYTSGDTIAQKKISDLKERVRIVNETPNSILVSIHQNTFSDGRYSGPQVFYASTSGSDTLARSMQSSLTEHLDPDGNRKSKRSSGIYLMEHIRCAGVLIECGFLSNPGEEKALSDPGYQKKLSCVIASVLSSHLSNT